VSEDVKQRAQMQLFEIFAYWGIRRTFAGLDANSSGAQQFPLLIPKKFDLKLPASQAQWSGWKRWEELEEEVFQASNFTTRSISREANILALINRIPIYNFCLHWLIWFQLVTGLDHSSLPFPSDSEELLRK
jgi:hypothetical protein